jgi:uncharacterized membrane protein
MSDQGEERGRKFDIVQRAVPALGVSMPFDQSTRRKFMTLLGGAAVTWLLVALFFAEVASAQKYRPAPRSYDADRSRAAGQRFTDEEQRIIDTITANGWRNGR